jgi:hypothetical protein
MRRGRARGRLGGMVSAPDRTTRRSYGRVLVLLALRNELRDRHAPSWRRERNRIEIDRAIAELAREGPHFRHDPVTTAFRPSP